MAKGTKVKTSKGISVAMSTGINRKRIASRGRGGNKDRIQFTDKEGNTIPVPVQFCTVPNEWAEYELHRYRDGKYWKYIPCLGDGCPKCDDESEEVSKTSYRFAAPVYNFTTKSYMVLEGPKTLAEKIMYRFDRCKGDTAAEKSKKFLKSTFEIVQFQTEPVSYGCDKGDEDPIMIKSGEIKDVRAYVAAQAEAEYGKDGAKPASSLDSRDGESDNADKWTKKDLKKKSADQLVKIAKKEGAGKKDLKAAGDNTKALIDLILGADDK